MEVRNNLIRILVGDMKTGKTFFLKNVLMKEWIEQRRGRIDERCLIIDAEDNVAYREFQEIKPSMMKTWVRGIKRIVMREDDSFDELFHYLRLYAWNMMLVFEDTTNYMDAQWLPEGFKRLCIGCTNRNTDIVFMFHYWGAVQCNLLPIAHRAHIFGVGDSPERKKIYIGKYDEVLTKWKEVQEKFKVTRDLPRTDPRRYPRADVKLKGD